jgi:hypothetical protein
MSPREYRLFHYTQKFETLQLILKNGFWPRYSPEDISWFAGCPIYLVVPMVCFCDIPVELSKEHQEMYGCYAIALNKDWGKSVGLTPLLYFAEDGPLAKHLNQRLGRAITKTTLNKDEFYHFWELLPYLKPTTGCLPEIGPSGRAGTHIKDFDIEMEWRYIPIRHKDCIYTADYSDQAADRAKASKLSEATRDSMLAFADKEIDLIVVPTNEERKKLLEAKSALDGRIKLWDEIKLL